MASISTEKESAAGLLVVDNSLPQMPSVETLLPKNATETPSDTLVVKVVPPESANALGTASGMPEKLLTEQTQPSAVIVEGEDSLEFRDIEEHRTPTSPAAGGQSSLTEIQAKKVSITMQTDLASTAVTHTLTERIESEAKNAGDSPVCQPTNNNLGDVQPDEPTSGEDLPIVYHMVPVTSEVDNSKEKSDQLGITSDVQPNSKTVQDEAGGNTEDELCDDGQNPVTKTLRQTSAASGQPRSVPPHLRLAPRPTNAQSAAFFEAKRHWPAPEYRAPRVSVPASGYQPPRYPFDLDELQRTRAQLMKARNDLEAERKINAEMRQTVGAEKQSSISAAMSEMLTELLQKQADALAAKAKACEKERELQYREEKIRQFEVYLSDGQRQLKYQLEQQGIRAMSAVDEANLRHEINLKTKHQFSSIEGKIAIQVERLRHQEAAQKIREQQYRVLVRDALKTEILEQLAQDVQTNVAEAKITKVAYERGLTEGKRIAVTGASETALKQEFLKGYTACYRSQVALHNMLHGRLAADSMELAFLHDPTHTENPHNIGLSIGRMEAGAAASVVSNVTISRTSMADAATATLRGRGQAHLHDADLHTPDVADRPEQARLAQQIRPQPQQEEPIRNSVPPRPTFAGELRGAANRSSPPSTANAPGTTAASSGPRAGLAGRVGEDIRYEDSDIEPASPNLIDLY
ncbi:hypothetical protein C7974DRAFT_215408 [Boeremia exigua]|uniref:uncharacterized protein n=1 Tax=Boeremia exigua TaxID=749465 RepID=UPI001E8E3692|nr:uncharacterized protein C7974DRAFT_215408 [Boeremia exigua]KAH6622057.1 hypothetical protein C7974DRAFT_215408 [Boeremia exigua]